MILFVDNNVGVLFLKKISGAVKEYITGTINTLSTLAAVMVGYGVVTVEVQTLSSVAGYAKGYGVLRVAVTTWSTISARMSALAHIYVSVFTRSIVQAFINLPTVVTEVIKKISTITTIFKRNSRIDGD